MQWLNKIVDEVVSSHPEGEIVVSSGVSPSGAYHLGTLREILTAEAIAYEVKRRGREVRHMHMVDDLDVFRKVPQNLPEDFKQYLGKPLCDVPSPDDSADSYANYFVKDLFMAVKKMHLSMEILRAHEQYRQGLYVSAIEKALTEKAAIERILETISGRKPDGQWSPIQVIEDGYLKNREFVSLDTGAKTLVFKDKDGHDRQTKYDHGEVKLNWRVDWPARWQLLGVSAEPFGRDHATKGGSYDTGAAIAKEIFDTVPPLPLPYNFINRTGDTKKMSKSSGDVITASDLLEILPAEVIWFFVLRYSPDKQLFFDEGPTLIRLVDEFGELLAKPNKSPLDEQLINICLHGVDKPTISRVPFSHLVASYQAALKDTDKALEIIRRTEHAEVVEQDAETIRAELRFIGVWLDKWAPDEVKFALRDSPSPGEFNDSERHFLNQLADKVAAAPDEADGDWFHSAIYELKNDGLKPQEMFSLLYRVLINKTSGPRAGWFLSILPRDWLVKRLKLEN